MAKKNEIAPIADLTSLPVSAAPMNLAEYATGSGGFLKRIQLVTKGRYVDLGKIHPGHYGVPGEDDEITDLGEAVDILPLAVRHKALDTTQDPPVAVYDPASEAFADIKERSGQPDSGCMFGPSVIVVERKTGELYEWFLGNKSAREEAPQLMPFLPVSKAQAEAFGVEAKPPQPCTISSRLIKRPRYSWHVPVISKCSTPFDNLPDQAIINAEVEKFLNPKAADVELAAETGGRSV